MIKFLTEYDKTLTVKFLSHAFYLFKTLFLQIKGSGYFREGDYFRRGGYFRDSRNITTPTIENTQ